MVSAAGDPAMPSIHERRRRAPLHYWAKAANARLAALVLDQAGADLKKSSAEVIGSTGIAVREAFLREVSIALELIIKAVVAQRVEMAIARKGVKRCSCRASRAQLIEQ